MKASQGHFCADCGAAKLAPNAAAKPLQYCTQCGAAQFSSPQSSPQGAVAPQASLPFTVRFAAAAVLVVALGSASFGISRLFIDKPQSSAEAGGTRNSAQNSGSDKNAQPASGEAASGNPMSRVTPEMQQRIAVLQDSVQRFPKNGDALLALANAWYDVGAFFQAEQHYARYLQEFDKKNVAARVDYAYTLLRQNRHDEAITETKKALEYEPNRVEALFNLGVIYYGQKNWVESKVWFEKCVKIAPGTEVAKSAEDIIKSIGEQQKGS
ncbi:MAG: tetratricopeptide repeat protein [Candidatus Kapaibacterium sp.]|nr:MAG: tetratricopeptide repeat protein [Candidatus Kapabacteria bacterium]